MTMGCFVGLEMVWKGSLQGSMGRKGRGSVAATSPARVSRPKRLPDLDDLLPYKAGHLLFMGASLAAARLSASASWFGLVAWSRGNRRWE